MSYQSSIPLASDLISVSQNDIKNNFTAIGTAFPVNHVNFNSSGAGKHTFVEMPIQTADPAGASGEFTIFSKSNGSTNELFYKRNNEGTSYQLSGTNPSVTTNGYTFLPGNLLMQWNFLTGSFKNDGASISFPIAFSEIPYSLQLTAARNGTTTMGLYATNVSSSGFTLRTSSNSNDGIWFLVIGKA